jgi:hypothetical protein
MHATSSRGRCVSKLALAFTAVAALLIPAAPAAAGPAAAPAVSITAYKITSDLPAFPLVPTNGPSTLLAGANSNSGSYTTFAYTNATEDLLTALTNFAPGLLGNPESVPKCSQEALEAGGADCPAGSAIGTSRLDAVVAGTTFTAVSLPGTMYNAVQLGNEPGRLAVVTPTPFGPLVSSIPFEITPRGGGDYGLTGTLTDVSRLPSPPFPADLQVSGLSFVINGATNKYVRNPTSCTSNVSTGQAIGYDDPTVVDGPAYVFPTFGCDQLAFDPQITMELGDAGTTKLNGYPPFSFKITQAAGQSDIRGTKVTLPVELNTNNTAYKLCTQAQADADACPADSDFGGVVAKSPFLAEPLVGPVYLVQQSSSSLPGLLLDLHGRVHVKLQTTTQLVNGRQIQSLILNAPQLPVSEFTVGLNGGKNTGVFQNRSDICFRGGSTSKFNSVNAVVKSYGWSGKNTADTKVTATVHGCGPGVKDSMSRARRANPRLKVEVTKHPGSPNMKELLVTLGRNLSVVRDKLESGASASAISGATFEYVSRHSFKVAGLPAAGVDKAALRLRGGAVKVSKHSRGALRKGRSRTFRVKVKQTPVSGAATSTRSSFRVKGKH